ncbi:MAG: hypothetical protein IJJ99_03020 [Oscillospiraceae bacterium]|nr:hypothetical protein [Oscillospiraceae bacterium]
MGAVIDLSGQVFGKLTVVSYAGSRNGNGALWLCKCDCGNITIKSGKMLRHHGKYASCGCYDGRRKRLVDLTGQRFGNLTVLHRVENTKDSKPQWLCQCDCGNQKIVQSKHLKSGDVKSCGCGKGIKRVGKRTQFTPACRPIIELHSHRNRLYNIWSGMHYRCEKPNASSYEFYGGRGICVCAEWSGKKGFDHFREWAVAHGYADDLEIDRIDNDLGYEPANCRWVTHQENAFNRRARGRSGIVGVSFRKDRPSDIGAWRACITVEGKSKYIGTFKTKEEAIAARKKAEMEIGLRKE